LTDPAPLRRTVVLIGLMGAGKSSVGRRLAETLGAVFRDSDDEIVAAAGMDIPMIFERLGETAFRDGERRVIERLLHEPPHVLATGGGAFMNAQTRALIKALAVSVWIRADLETLVERTARKADRPLLRAGNPREILGRLIDQRHPVYAEADLVVDSPQGGPHEAVVDAIRAALPGVSAMASPARAVRTGERP
jgi:shikimate kinase